MDADVNVKIHNKNDEKKKTVIKYIREEELLLKQ